MKKRRKEKVRIKVGRRHTAEEINKETKGEIKDKGHRKENREERE